MLENAIFALRFELESKRCDLLLSLLTIGNCITYNKVLAFLISLRYIVFSKIITLESTWLIDIAMINMLREYVGSTHTSRFYNMCVHSNTFIKLNEQMDGHTHIPKWIILIILIILVHIYFFWYIYQILRRLRCLEVHISTIVIRTWSFQMMILGISLNWRRLFCAHISHGMDFCIFFKN